MSHYEGLVKYRVKRIFRHPEAISRHLVCGICCEVFEDPVRTMCGHTFCYICIQQWATIKKNCPLCKKPIGGRQLEGDLIAAGMVGDLEVNCFYEGCKWAGIESFRKKHQRCCESKPKNSIPNESIPTVEVNDLDEQEVLAFDLTSQSH